MSTHYLPGADTNHFLGRCEECDAHYLANATLAQVEEWHRLGWISPDQFEAFRHVWTTSAARFGNYAAWMILPTGEVARHATLIRAAAAARAAAR